MASSTHIPWIDLHDFLAEAGGERNPVAFCRKTLQLLNRLTPYDTAHLIILEPSGNVSFQEVIELDEKWLRAYADYFMMIDPCKKITPPQAHLLSSNRWLNHRTRSKNEFFNDYLKPQKIFYSSGLQLHDAHNRLAAALILGRSRQSGNLNTKDMTILGLIQPHLSNLLANLLLASPDINPGLGFATPKIPDADEIFSEYSRLTRREAEITALLCQRYSTGMIESKLLISRLTIYKHIEHIFEKLNVTSREKLLEKILGRDV